MKRNTAAIVFAFMATSSYDLVAETPRVTPEQVVADSQLSSRMAISAGMGVDYFSAPDVVDYINSLLAQSPVRVQRIPEFKSAVQFFGALVYPLSPDWVLKAEYLYLLASYNPGIPGFSTDFTLTAQMPSLILQYVLWDERLYSIKAGAGLGYHFATLTEKFLIVDDRLAGKGLGVVADIEANTAFGDHLFAYLGGDMRWEAIGTMKSTLSGSQTSRPISLPTGNAFGIGARLGLSYYF